MRTIITLLLFFPLFSQGQVAKDSITFICVGVHDLTDYTYTFYYDGRFESDITGHLGNDGITKGVYTISNDTIYVTPLVENLQTNKYYNRQNEKFLIDRDSCIIDLQMRYDFKKLKPGYNEMYISKQRLVNSSPIKKQKKK